jgi:hypothetical protein
MIEIFSGKPGSGKSLKMADIIVSLLARNERWYKKSGQRRKIVTNLQLSKEFELLYPDYIEYWQEPIDLLKYRDVDIVWDEIATHLDSTQWANVPLDLKRFLQQHRKRGIDIYGTTQAFAMVDVSMRRLVDTVHVCYKLVGSRNPSPTKPPISYIWGLIWISQLDPMTFEDEKPKHTGWDWLFITQKLVNVYDTKQEILRGTYPPYQHIERTCVDENCEFHKIIHA